MTPIGFTGTRLGYDAGAAVGFRGERAKTMFTWLCYLRQRFGSIEAHHGDCIGSDDDFHKQCRALGIPRVIHPPDNDSKRAFCHMREPGLSKANYTRVLEPAPYMERNQTIVEATALLLATPESAAPGAWSGSMSTVRYAQKVGRWVVLVGPDGSWDELGSLGGRPWDKGNWR